MTWLGFSDEGIAATADSDEVVRILVESWDYLWTPVADFSNKDENVCLLACLLLLRLFELTYVDSFFVRLTSEQGVSMDHRLDGQGPAVYCVQVWREVPQGMSQ